jgi:hypothetical protein
MSSKNATNLITEGFDRVLSGQLRTRNVKADLGQADRSVIVLIIEIIVINN